MDRAIAPVALYGICTQQHSSDGVFKKQCYSSSAFGIVGFHSGVCVKPGISADTNSVLFKDPSALLIPRTASPCESWFSQVYSVFFFTGDLEYGRKGTLF